MTATLTITKGATTLDLLAAPYSFVGEPDYGGVTNVSELITGPGLDLPRFGPLDRSSPRSIPLSIFVTGTDADDVNVNVAALMASLPDEDTPATLTIGADGGTCTGTRGGPRPCQSRAETPEASAAN